MTAITAFKCPDGLVMAAETEESYADNKVYTYKLFPGERPGKSRFCLAGAGLGYLIDHARDRVIAAIDSGIKNTDQFEFRLAEILDSLYKREFRHFPVESPVDLRIQLLVGVQFISESDPAVWLEPALYECQSNLVISFKNPTRRSCVLGAGELLKETAVQFAGWGLSVELAEWVSVYLIHEAKRRFGGVGGRTHIFTMRNDGTFSHDLGKNTREKEGILEGFSRATQLFMLSLEPSVPKNRAADLVDAGTRWLRDARRALQKIEAGIEKPKHASIEIRSREIEKMFRRLRLATPLASQKSEPGP
jgi:hypothetical protein